MKPNRSIEKGKRIQRDFVKIKVKISTSDFQHGLSIIAINC